MAIRSPAPRVNPARGFSLAECLLALALFSVGLLGTGALMTERLREGRAAHTYFLAGMLAQDLAARIQANPTAAAGEDFDAWQRQAAAALPGLQCDTAALGGLPPAHRVELEWPLGSAESGRLVIWLGR